MRLVSIVQCFRQETMALSANDMAAREAWLADYRMSSLLGEFGPGFGLLDMTGSLWRGFLRPPKPEEIRLVLNLANKLCQLYKVSLTMDVSAGCRTWVDLACVWATVMRALPTPVKWTVPEDRCGWFTKAHYCALSYKSNMSTR